MWQADTLGIRTWHCCQAHLTCSAAGTKSVCVLEHIALWTVGLPSLILTLALIYSFTPIEELLSDCWNVRDWKPQFIFMLSGIFGFYSAFRSQEAIYRTWWLSHRAAANYFPKVWSARKQVSPNSWSSSVSREGKNDIPEPKNFVTSLLKDSSEEIQKRFYKLISTFKCLHNLFLLS